MTGRCAAKLEFSAQFLEFALTKINNSLDKASLLGDLAWDCFMGMSDQGHCN